MAVALNHSQHASGRERARIIAGTVHGFVGLLRSDPGQGLEVPGEAAKQCKQRVARSMASTTSHVFTSALRESGGQDAGTRGRKHSIGRPMCWGDSITEANNGLGGMFIIVIFVLSLTAEK